MSESDKPGAQAKGSGGEAGGFGSTADLAATGAAFADIASRSVRIYQAFLDRQSEGSENFEPIPAAAVFKVFADLSASWVRHPGPVVAAQMRFWHDYAALSQHTAQRLLTGAAVPAVAEPDPGDRRFKDEQWVANPVFDHIKQSYLICARFVLACVSDNDGLDPRAAERAQFYAQQFVDAMAPSNFAHTNPAVLQRTMETGGENLVSGLRNLLSDLERGDGRLRIRMTDESKFELGGNVATTPGKVVFQNDLIQLIQYEPKTESVHKRPLLIFPPWINKYYILDLRPKNSFVRWAVEAGHTVFMVSWVNPDERLAAKRFDDYMVEGVLGALDAVEAATGERRVNAIGYCLGGTLLAATLACMASRKDDRIAAATFLTTMTDFAVPGGLGIFIDEEQLKSIERQMDERGYFEGASMAEVFNMLRANDLIWSFVVNNYLLGQDPFPFDLLYWNSDSTRMPRDMHSFYLRKMYQENRLVEPGAISLDETPVDLRAIQAPVYILSTREDHIAPWRSTYAATQLYAGEVRFVLAASGHIAGVVNPPESGKYGYWTGEALPANADEWLADAQEYQGSWWLHWQAWIEDQDPDRVPARVPGTGGLKVIEDAPGSYVRVRST